MKIFDNFEIVDPFPAVYAKDTDAIVISDLHLGLEGLMAEAGTYMPKFQLDEIKEEFEVIMEKKEPERVIICGDIKHEFSKASYDEREEVQNLVEFLSENVSEIFLVKGNHDNYLIYPVKEYENVRLAEYFVLGDTCYVHGDKLIGEESASSAEYLVMGHKHPSLALEDEVGVKEKIACFLYESMRDGRKLLVLPAFSPLASGSDIRKPARDELTSPFFDKYVEIKDFKAIGVDRETGIYEFPKVGELMEIF